MHNEPPMNTDVTAAAGQQLHAALLEQLIQESDVRAAAAHHDGDCKASKKYQWRAAQLRDVRRMVQALAAQEPAS